jgi:Xaa-Pro aminopeptidase
MAHTDTPSFDLDRFQPPPMLTKEELEGKLGHLRGVLDRRGLSAILLSQEGAVRWLTGTRHQIIDIAPDAESPVHALVHVRPEAVDVALLTTRIEMPRVHDQLTEVFRGMEGVRVEFRESPGPPSESLLPGATGYEEAVGEIVRPLLGGPNGNQVRKVAWLHSMTVAVLAQTALRLEVGMNGAEVRGRVFSGLASRDVECNLILVALAGQEKHFHPLYDARYRVERGGWVKLVTGTRYAEAIVSATVMVKVGCPPSKEESRVYAALQRGVVEYADLYRNGMSESQIHKEVGERFARIERETGLGGFQASAYFHHLGGPTSPLGNRDYILEAGGTRSMFPWMQFAINPCDVLQHTKAELQGIVMPDGAPLMLDGSRFVPKDLGMFSEVRAQGGTVAMVPNVIVAAG